LLVIVAAHSLVSFVFLHSDEFSLFKVAVKSVFFNKLLGLEVPGAERPQLFRQGFADLELVISMVQPQRRELSQVCEK
jgi:hypothetical protein